MLKLNVSTLNTPLDPEQLPNTVNKREQVRLAPYDNGNDPSFETFRQANE